MKKSFLLPIVVSCVIAILDSSCSKSADVDPREQYLGRYQVTYTQTTEYSRLPKEVITGTTSLTVSKGTNNNSLTFKLPTESAEVTLSGSSFTFDPVVKTVIAGTQTTTASGSFIQNGLEFTQKTTVSSNEYTQQLIAKGIKP
ncbi:hypothetical protein ACFSUS_24265 [Spirosoma soli]|uniref:Lipocalin-like domain-containing protein n=1 Tax=Spirosoma soli TaxID=1770529 RepID=A0ABW5MAS4_9BACT